MWHRRLKDNFSIIRAEDRPKLLQAKEEVEVEMQKLKWTDLLASRSLPY